MKSQTHRLRVTINGNILRLDLYYTIVTRNSRPVRIASKPFRDEFRIDIIDCEQSKPIMLLFRYR